jgi:predicted ferric reductase
VNSAENVQAAAVELPGAARARRGPRSPVSARAIAAALWAIATVNAGLIVWLWLHGGGVSGVQGAADLWTSLGRITGLLGVYLALVQVLLLARLPPLERLVGFDRLTVWHRRNGKACLALVLAHVVFITIGYAGSDQISVPSEFSRLLDSYPGMVTATIGTALMVAVVVTSLVIARRRLPYEAWYAVHLTVYAGIALSYLHQIPTGNEFTANTSQADYWIGLYVVTLVLLLVFRVAWPARLALRHRLRVAAVTSETPGVVSLTITGRRLERLPAQGGQFLLWRFLARGRWWQSHPFSLSAAPDGRTLRITVKGVGRFSRELASLRPGTRVVAEGPYGAFTAARRTRPRVALIAGGIGITPIRALLDDLPAPPGAIALVYRVVAEDELVFREELEALARDRGLDLFFVVGDHRSPQGEQLLSADALTRMVPDLAERDVFLCGPGPMMDHTRRALRSAGVARGQIHSERFALAA